MRELSVDPAVELIGITKVFGTVAANRAVDLAIARGTIHGLVGENGAGKSTLMNILYGTCRPDEGDIRRDGKPVRIASTRDAIAHGIGMVHQHFTLVDSMSGLDNIMLGAEGSILLPRSRARTRDALARLARAYGLAIDGDTPVGALAVGAQQRVEILKALHRGAELLILDEPTAVLTPQETDSLFQILKMLKAQGKTIVLISHKLREVLAVTDQVTVMRAGAVVATRPTQETNEAELAELMIGRRVALRPAATHAVPGPALLEIEGLVVPDERGIDRVHDVGFTLHQGEIVGIAGISGNGQSELLEALAGLRPIAGGSVRLRGRELVTRGALPSPLALASLGIVHTPEDRLRMGLVAAFPAYESVLLGRQHDSRFHRGPLLDRAAIVAHCRTCIDDFSVRPTDPDLATGLFSGGNQQKLVLARAFACDPALLLVGQPSRGVDIGAIELIHRRLLALRDAGKTILVLSADLDELLALCDRILVMADGRIVGSQTSHDADAKTIGLMMAGIPA